MIYSPPLNRLLYLVVLISFTAGCAPRTGAPHIDPVGNTVKNNDEVFTYLVTPFQLDLQQLGMTINSFDTYRYGGSDQNAFIEAVNTFYLINPGFCPLQNAFYAAANGWQFMTLASDGSSQIRGFLYDQSNRPQLLYGYFEAETTFSLAATSCETANQD